MLLLKELLKDTITAMHIISYPLEDAQWSSTRWKSVENNIAQLQHRIAKATLENDYRKVRHLQRLLVRSLSARLKAVRQVSEENSGKQTPGADNELWKTPKRKLMAALELRKRSKTKPLRRIYIPKKDGTSRLLGIPAMIDRARQALWNLALNPVVESTSDPISYGFRPHRGCWDANAQIRVFLSRKDSPTWILDADIRKCFDTISHDWLLANTPMEKKVLRSWLKSGFIESSGEFFDTEAGTPQGGVISPTLSNHVLNGLHDVLKASFPLKQIGPSNKRTTYSPKVNLVRYADDFIVTGRDKMQLERAKEVISDFLRPRGLELHPTKTKIVTVYEGFDFLGWNFRKMNNGKLLSIISKESQKSHRQQLREVIKKAGNSPPSALISKLNPIIRGWCNYHRCAHCIWKVWNSTNQYLFRLLWKWAQNRHQRRSRYWIYDRYWKHFDGRRTFSDSQALSKDSPSQTIKDATYKLVHYNFGVLPIRRISGQTNVYLLDKETRTKIRRVWKMKHIDKEVGIRKNLWRRQRGVCTRCNHLLPPSGHSLTDIHHKVPLSRGGSNRLDNLELIHEHCHYEHHANSKASGFVEPKPDLG